jgi:acyl-CoA synthetase (AMP-forming)/AMP-acid ligase II
MAWNIADLIEHAVDAVPERVALIDDNRSETFAELEERANRLAHHLQSLGVTKDQHVGIYAYNRVEFVEAMLAAYKIRAVPINVNYRYVEDELRYLFDNADLVALVYERQFAPRIAAVADELPLLRSFVELDDGTARTSASEALGAVDYEAALALQSADRDFEARTDDDLYVLYTGGTTGMPKGVVWRHEDVLRVLGGGIVFETGEKIEDDRTFSREGKAAEPITSIAIAPLMHGAAQWTTFSGLFRGNATVLVRQFDPHAVWRAVERHKVASLSITGDAMGRPLVEALAEADYDVSSIVTIASTAAVFSPAVKDAFCERFPSALVIEAVGSSESGYNGATMWEKGSEQHGLPTVTMGPDTLVLDDELRPIEPGSGRIGRMARGGNVPLRYYKDPEKSAATFVEVDGKRYSIPGDYARVEADGRMTLLGRGSVCINSGGEKIYPEEVESALKSHPDVYDAIVVGVPDDRWGQRVAAVVQPRPGAAPTLDDLAEHCRTHIAGYKVPRELHVVGEIRRSPSGKPDYPWAKQVATGQQA